MEITEVFAKRLKELREDSGLNQSQLAEKLGVSRGSISYYENQDRTPDIVFLDKVSTFFGVSLNYLLGHSANKEEKNEEIGVRLGLSDEAIKKLERMREDEIMYPEFFGKGGFNRLEILSNMINNEMFLFLIESIRQFATGANDFHSPDSFLYYKIGAEATMLATALRKKYRPNAPLVLESDSKDYMEEYHRFLRGESKTQKEDEENGDSSAKKE